MIAAVHSMRCGGATGRKILKLLMMAALLGVVEAGGLVRDGCWTFRCSDFPGGGAGTVAGFSYGCSYACGQNWDPYGDCPATDQTPADCDTKCVRQHPRLLLAPVSSSHLRLLECCVARALHHILVCSSGEAHARTLVRVLQDVFARVLTSLSSLLLSFSL